MLITGRMLHFSRVHALGLRHVHTISFFIQLGMREGGAERETDLRRPSSGVSFEQPARVLVGNLDRDQDIVLALTGDVQRHRRRRRQTRRKRQRKTSSYIILSASCKNKIMTSTATAAVVIV